MPRIRLLLFGVVMFGAIGFAFFSAEAFLPLSLSDVRHQPAEIIGLPLTAGTLAWTAGAWIPEREAHRRSRRSLAGLGLGLLALGIACIAAILTPATPLLVAVAGWMFAGLGMGIAYSTAALVILESVPAEPRHLVSVRGLGYRFDA